MKVGNQITMKLNGIKIAVNIKIESASNNEAELKNLELGFDIELDSIELEERIFGRRDDEDRQ